MSAPDKVAEVTSTDAVKEKEYHLLRKKQQDSWLHLHNPSQRQHEAGPLKEVLANFLVREVLLEETSLRIQDGKTVSGVTGSEVVHHHTGSKAISLSQVSFF